MEKLKKYLLENDETLKDIVNELNSWCGALDYLYYQENDEDFFNTYFENRPDEAVRAVCYGEYEYMDDYVKFNAYGNLESASECEIIEEMKSYIDDIIENLISEKDNIYINDAELKELLEEDEESEDQE